MNLLNNRLTWPYLYIEALRDLKLPVKEHFLFSVYQSILAREIHKVCERGTICK